MPTRCKHNAEFCNVTAGGKWVTAELPRPTELKTSGLRKLQCGFYYQLVYLRLQRPDVMYTEPQKWLKKLRAKN